MRAIAVYVDQLHGELDELHRQLNARRGAYGSSLSTVKLTAQAFKQFEKSVDLIDGKVLSRRSLPGLLLHDRLHGFPGLFTDMLLTVILTCFPSPTHSFIPGLKPSFSANPSHCSLSFSSSGLNDT